MTEPIKHEPTKVEPAKVEPPKPESAKVMKQADILLRLEKHGQDVMKYGVTPAEVAILVSEHNVNAGGNPVVESKDQPDVARTDMEELERLRSRYSGVKVGAMYPGAKPSLPTSFKEAIDIGLRTTMPGTKMLIKA